MVGREGDFLKHVGGRKKRQVTYQLATSRKGGG